MISIVTPAFNESTNLDRLYGRLAAALASLQLEWEWLIVDDHSRDDTFSVIERLAAADPRVRGLRLARNSGSHTAIVCGLHHAAGAAAVLMAADLQDPPEMLGDLIARWRAGAQVVWAVRRHRPGDARHQRFAALYYWVMRRLVGMREMPANGADFFLIDRVVIDAVRRCRERHTSIFALITWLGFRQERVEYDKQPRAHGRSGWTLDKKVKLVVDSVAGFSDFPIWWCLYLGAALAVLAAVIALLGLAALPTLRSALMLIVALVLGLSGLQLTALAIVGHYVWRALDESRGRPAWEIEATAGAATPAVRLQRAVE